MLIDSTDVLTTEDLDSIENLSQAQLVRYMRDMPAKKQDLILRAAKYVTKCYVLEGKIEEIKKYNKANRRAEEKR